MEKGTRFLTLNISPVKKSFLNRFSIAISPKKILATFTQLNRSQRFYVLGIYALSMLFLCKFLAVTYLEKPFAQLFLLLAILGILNDVLSLYKILWSTHIGKAAVLIIYAFCANIAFALASQAINSIILVETFQLPHTITFVAILTTPIFIIMGLIIAFTFSLLFFQFYLIFLKITKDLREIPELSTLFPNKMELWPIRTSIVRIFFISIIGFMLSKYTHQLMPKYDAFLEENTSAFIYHFEAYPHSRCVLKEGEKVIPLEDEEIIIASKKIDGGYKFEHSVCTPKLTSNHSLQ